MTNTITSSLDILDAFFDNLDDRTIDMAEECYLRGRINWIDYSFGPIKCQATVIGSKQKVYKLFISEKGGSCFASCSCRTGYNCKHIGAALFYLEDILECEKRLGPLTQNITIENQIPVPEEIKNWISSLNHPQLQKTQNTQKPNQKKQLIYVLRTHPFHLKIEIQLQSLKKDGSPSNSMPKKVRLESLVGNQGDKTFDFFDEADWNIVNHAIRNRAIAHNAINLRHIKDYEAFIKKTADTGRMHYELWEGSVLSWGEKRSGKFQWEIIPDRLRQELVCKTTPPSTNSFSVESSLFYVDIEKKEIGPVLFHENPDMLNKLLHAPPIPFDKVNNVLEYIESEASYPIPCKPQKLQQKEVQAKPTAHILLEPKKAKDQWYYGYGNLFRIGAAPYFKYSEHKVAYTPERSKKTLIPDSEGYYIIERDHEFEEKMIKSLSKLQLSLSSENIFIYERLSHNSKDGLIKHFLEEHSEFLIESGWNIEFHSDFSIKEFYETDDWYAETLEEGNGWLSLEMGIEINGVRHNITPLLKQISSRLNYNTNQNLLQNPFLILYTENGTALKVPTERIKKLIDAFSLEFKSQNGDKLKIPEWGLQLLNEANLGNEAANLRWFGERKYHDLAKQLKNKNLIQKTNPPEQLSTELRPYQQEGLNWLQFLKKHRLCGILADDMGLGKTIQVLSHIQSEIENEQKIAPILIIVPKSLIFNWVNEIKKHVPSLSYLILHGNSRQEYYQSLPHYDIALITYSLLANDKEMLLQHHFHMIVLDEAQNIKNPKTKAYAALQQLKADHRLCISGTPIENHLGELWSIVNFLMPGYLGNQKVFNQIFRTPIEKKGDEKQKENLNKRLSPVLLRRNKELVAKDLPSKTEIIERIEFEERQRDLYEAVRIRVYDNLLQEVQKKGIEASKIAILDAILKLRQVCCDPRLLKTQQKIQDAKSAKLEHLMKMMQQLIDNGSRILLFSQFTSMLELIEIELQAKGIEYSLLTGQTTKREEQVDRFQNRQVPLMLLSLKAGGVGLNLTEADTVIHYDPWWNPAVENQATDRTHRIGQTKKVFIYKLIINGSIEEKILELQQRKKSLAGALFKNNEAKSFDLSLEDIDLIFRPLS